MRGAWRGTALAIDEEIELTTRMTVAQYAKHRKVTRAAVYRAIAECRIVRELDGSIDPARADRMWSENTNPASRWAAGGEDIVLTEADIDQLLG